MLGIFLICLSNPRGDLNQHNPTNRQQHNLGVNLPHHSTSQANAQRKPPARGPSSTQPSRTQRSAAQRSEAQSGPPNRNQPVAPEYYSARTLEIPAPKSWEGDYTDDSAYRVWRKCAFNAIRGDPIDQFVFTLLGGRVRPFSIANCDVWSGGCPCASPLEHISQGTFVEIGANDGLHMSNSYFFERYLGWRGLCVEASPQIFSLLERNRPNCTNINALVATPKFDGNVCTHTFELPGCCHAAEVAYVSHSPRLPVMIPACRAAGEELPYLSYVRPESHMNLSVEMHNDWQVPQGASVLPRVARASLGSGLVRNRA